MTLSSTRLDASRTDPVLTDAGLWASFSKSEGDRAFLSSWLALLVNRIGKANYGTIMQADLSQGAFVPVAIVPDPRRDVSDLGPVSEQVLNTGRPATLSGEDGVHRVAYPVRIEGAPVQSVIAVCLDEATRAEIQGALRELHWASGWLTARAWEARSDDQQGQLARAAVALDLLALSGEHARPEPAAMAVVNELQRVLACDRVSLGMVVKRRTSPRIRMMAISHSAVFRKRSVLVEGLEAVMEEAFDQNAPVSWPAVPQTERAIAVAHADHVKSTRAQSIITAPLSEQNEPVGAITAERRRGEPFGPDDVLMLESVAALIGPMLEMKRRNRRWIGGRIWDGLLHGLGVVLGPRRLSWKLLAVALIGLGVAAATVTAPFRIQAEAVLRGTVQRAAVAPYNGFIGEALVRAGDIVEQGQLLARLDDTDLRLEELRWASELDRLAAQQRDAIAKGERSQAAFVDAQIAQAKAQLDLTRLELDRTRITAPIAGTVVTGDLSQRLGSPVQTGEVLFEIAPLDAFRVDMYVDERDLPHISDTMRGRVALAGQPSDGLPFRITRITPVAEPRDGVNTFRTEALLEVDGADLRPGMEGVAKIDVGRELLAWTWTRRLGDWLRRTAWTWQP